jgi:hypothetical protein
MLIRRCAQLETTTPRDITTAAVYTLRLLARRILARTDEIHDLDNGSPTQSLCTARPC